MILWVQFLRIMASLAVVLLHVVSSCHFEKEVPAWWVVTGYDASARWCVPMFVMLTGAFSLGSREQTIWAEYKKMGKRIFIPVIFWTTFYLFFRSIEAHSFALRPFMTDILRGKPYYHLWYLYMLCPMLLFIPFMKRLVANSSRGFIGWFCVLGFIMIFFNDAVNVLISTPQRRCFISMFIRFIPIIFLGYLLYTSNARYSFIGLLFGVVVSVFCVVLGVYYFGGYFRAYLNPIVIFLSCCVFQLVRQLRINSAWKKNLEKGGELSFGVYLIHPLILEMLRDKISYEGLEGMVWVIPAVTCCVFLLSLLVSALIGRIKFIKYVIGV